MDGICAEATWSRTGVTVAGGNGDGQELNQLSSPIGVFIDQQDYSVYVADQLNHRIVKWSPGASIGQLIAGGRGIGDKNDMLSEPVGLVIDQMGAMIICDYGNNRIQLWPKDASQGSTLIGNISCVGVTTDTDGFLYVTEYHENRVTKWDLRKEIKSGQVVAGGNGIDAAFNQLFEPYFSFVDRDHSVLVSDHGNNRIVKWSQNASEGILLAGGNATGNNTDQLSLPCSVIVDHMGSIYVTDVHNNRVLRYLKESKVGDVIAGGSEGGADADHLNEPYDLSFDRYGNLYVVDQRNHRVQMFQIDKSACSAL